MHSAVPHAPEGVSSRSGSTTRNLFATLLAAAALVACERQTGDSQSAGIQVIKTACGMEMVPIPAGQFTMGVKEGPIDAKPAHSVKVEGFLMDRHEVTQQIYEGVTGKNPSRRKHPKNPVEQVTWSAAVVFCNARSVQEGLTPCYNTNTWACDFSASGYRLPSEAEWEDACRAGGTNSGESGQALNSAAWFAGNSQSQPHPAGQKRPNAWGLYDMTGNVWEWCNDFYAAKYYRESPGDNPRGPGQGEKRVLRGGAWSSSAGDCTYWVRNCDEAGLTDVCLTMDSNGFRCVRKR